MYLKCPGIENRAEAQFFLSSLAKHARRGRTELPPTSNEQGYSLHAATHIPATDRALRERLCRYIARPPLAQGRLSLTDDGQVLWKRRSRWRDGTQAFRFGPIVFIERLVAIIPHPREHQLSYHGVFAPSSSLRHLVVPRPSATDPEDAHCHGSSTAIDLPEPTAKLHTGSSTYRWPELIARVINKDVMRCPNCRGHRTLLTAITDPFTIRRILAHFGLPTEVTPLEPPIPPPGPDLVDRKSKGEVLGEGREGSAS
ncbi:MAG: hypothetical protein ACI89E_000329 [Planctomycetota bacterium]